MSTEKWMLKNEKDKSEGNAETRKENVWVKNNMSEV